MYQTKQSATADCTRKVKVWVSRLKGGEGGKSGRDSQHFWKLLPIVYIAISRYNKEVDVSALKI